MIGNISIVIIVSGSQEVSYVIWQYIMVQTASAATYLKSANQQMMTTDLLQWASDTLIQQVNFNNLYKARRAGQLV